MFDLDNVLTIFSTASVALANLSNLFQAGSTAPWWLLWLLLIIALLSLVATWLSQMSGNGAVAADGAEVTAQQIPPTETTSAPDDLTRIEGIGPKISNTLQEAGIATFSQLAATEMSRLEALLQAADLRLANPDTWPEQAKLAAAGDWDALQVLQDELKGGRRVD